MATIWQPLPDGEAPLEEVDQPLTDRVDTRKERRMMALRDGNTREEKARVFAAHLAAALLAEMASGETPMLWETIEPPQEDWLALMELCETSPDAATRGLPQTAEAQVIARALFNHTAQQAAFLLGVAIGRRLVRNTEKEGEQFTRGGPPLKARVSLKANGHLSRALAIRIPLMKGRQKKSPHGPKNSGSSLMSA